MLKLLTACAAALFATCSGAFAESPNERGAYLVDAVMGCDGCHTPRGPNMIGFDMSRRFSGGFQVWDEREYLVRGSNISSDKETGIGSWSVNDIKRLLTEGMRPSGIKVVHQMPYPFYQILTARDLEAVAVYIKAAAPVRNQVPPPVYRAPSHTVLIPGGEKPFTEEMLKDPLKRGFYLATTAHCMECHSRTPDGKQDYGKGQGRGGYVFKTPKGGQVKTANISSHKTAGIGALTDAQIKRTLTEGVARDGRPLGLQMQRQVYYAKMTDQDLDALVAWVRTIPPVE